MQPESDAEEVAAMLVREMARQGVDVLASPIFDAGPAYVLMVGPHSEGRDLCWCQPGVRYRPCPGQGHDHAVLIHRDGVH